MIDFLRSNPWCSRDEYLWGMTVPQVSLASCDFSHINYSERRAKRAARRKGGSGKTMTINTAEDLKGIGFPEIKH